MDNKSNDPTKGWYPVRCAFYRLMYVILGLS